MTAKLTRLAAVEKVVGELKQELVESRKQIYGFSGSSEADYACGYRVALADVLERLHKALEVNDGTVSVKRTRKRRVESWPIN